MGAFGWVDRFDEEDAKGDRAAAPMPAKNDDDDDEEEEEEGDGEEPAASVATVATVVPASPATRRSTLPSLAGLPAPDDARFDATDVTDAPIHSPAPAMFLPTSPMARLAIRAPSIVARPA